MSGVLVTMRIDLIRTLNILAATLKVFALNVPGSPDGNALDIDTVQKGLWRAQQRLDSVDYLRKYGVNPNTRQELTAAIHEWLCAADEYRLVTTHAVWPHRVDQFEAHNSRAIVHLAVINEHVNALIAWGSRTE